MSSADMTNISATASRARSQRGDDLFWWHVESFRQRGDVQWPWFRNRVLGWNVFTNSVKAGMFHEGDSIKNSLHVLSQVVKMEKGLHQVKALFEPVADPSDLYICAPPIVIRHASAFAVPNAVLSMNRILELALHRAAGDLDHRTTGYQTLISIRCLEYGPIQSLEVRHE